MLQFLLELDGKILLFIQEYLHFDWLTPIMKFISSLGDNGLIWIILAALFLCIKKYRHTGITMAVSLLIGYVIANLLLKNLVARVRPYEVMNTVQLMINKQNDWSFPSGHTTSSLAASIVMFKQLPKFLGIPALVLGIFISFSRLYLGVHYPTDVLIGVVIGVIAANIAQYIVKTK